MKKTMINEALLKTVCGVLKEFDLEELADTHFSNDSEPSLLLFNEILEITEIEGGLCLDLLQTISYSDVFKYFPVVLTSPSELYQSLDKLSKFITRISEDLQITIGERIHMFFETELRALEVSSIFYDWANSMGMDPIYCGDGLEIGFSKHTGYGINYKVAFEIHKYTKLIEEKEMDFVVDKYENIIIFTGNHELISSKINNGEISDILKSVLLPAIYTNDLDNDNIYHYLNFITTNSNLLNLNKAKEEIEREFGVDSDIVALSSTIYLRGKNKLRFSKFKERYYTFIEDKIVSGSTPSEVTKKVFS